jgi:hypothetical protein
MRHKVYGRGMKLASAVRRALKIGDSEAQYKAAGELAITYAKAIDDGADLDEYGPLLLEVLESMLLTPRARAAALKGGQRDRAPSPLDELRTRRDQRLAGPAPVDSPPS